MDELTSYIEQEQPRYLKELFEFLKIPSISSLSERKPDIQHCAEWVAGQLKAVGIEDARIVPTEGHPIVFGQWLGAGPNAKTLLIYGHYDVQPVDPLDLWITEPFDPQVRDGKIYARGSADDKGQVFTHIKGVEALFKVSGKPPVNVKFLIEGEEEAGDSHLDQFIIDNAGLLACDAVMISDTEWFAEGVPSICYGLRGISFIEVKVTGPNRDLHSGSYGGAVENPLNVLCWMVSQLKDRYGRVTIPGFYDNVLPLTEKEKNEYLKLPFNLKAYCEDLDVPGVHGEYGFTTLERVWARPSLDLNGIHGGYTGEGVKTILPSWASAKISMRLVPNQKGAEITEMAVNYIKSLAPPTVKVDVHAYHGGNPVLVPLDSPGVKAAVRAFKSAFGMEPVFMREGGSIPVVELFESVLHAPSVLLGWGLPSDNIHSPNESFSLNNFYGGIKASAIFMEEFSRI